MLLIKLLLCQSPIPYVIIPHTISLPWNVCNSLHPCRYISILWTWYMPNNAAIKKYLSVSLFQEDKKRKKVFIHLPVLLAVFCFCPLISSNNSAQKHTWWNVYFKEHYKSLYLFLLPRQVLNTKNGTTLKSSICDTFNNMLWLVFITEVESALKSCTSDTPLKFAIFIQHTSNNIEPPVRVFSIQCLIYLEHLSSTYFGFRYANARVKLWVL